MKYTLSAIPAGSTRRVYGIAHHDGTRWWARVGESLLDARWNASVRPEQGLSIVVDITNDGQGQSTALVMCAYVDQPTPSTGTIQEFIPAGAANEVVFQADDGIIYRTDQVIGTGYNLGDPIYLNWDANKPTIMGKIGALAPPPPPVAPVVPGPGAGTGQVRRVASASDTFGVGGWGRWAGSQRGGEKVYTGSQSGYTVTGSWFYGAPDPTLAGKTVTRIRFYLPARLPAVGAYNSTVTIHLYAHTSQSRPGGDVSRVTAAYDVNVSPGFGGGLIDLPLSFAAAIAAGGGISIAGDPYTGFISRLDNPEAGKLLLDWSA